MPTVAITVTGKVQGVWFRASTRNKALELEINGFVRNQPDGTVYIEAQGNTAQLKALLEWCKDGPTHAQVDEVEFEELSDKRFTDFLILR